MSHAADSELVVVDASVAAMWVLSEAHSSSALSLAADWVRAEVQAIAPGFMLTEVTNAVYKRVRRGELSVSQAREALDVVLSFGVRLEESPDLHRRALDLAYRFNRPTPYDAHYLALAELHTCEVWTGDERLYNAVGPYFSWLRWVGTYQPTGNRPRER
ncbi:MAG: PIN domain-containing protein [Chloroflexota bacterium]|nr:MAG: PIN domain-containing protein [Chloroflexota bacterium]